jgi:hypothetical protein
MVHEKSLRRSNFQDGIWVRLADGQRWCLPEPPSSGTDDEYESMFQALQESEDATERSQAELAMAVLLLSRNYNLGPWHYQELLGFDDNPEGLRGTQYAVEQHISSRLQEVCIEERLLASRPPLLQSLLAFCSGRLRSASTYRPN